MRYSIVKIYEIRLLSNEFYTDFTLSMYPEMEDKQCRPFLVLIIKIEDNKFAIPFRTNVKHKYCYKFLNTNRNTTSSTALDFSKAVVINDDKYLGSSATIDRKEYLELENKTMFIIKKFITFILKYKKIMKNPSINRYEYELLSKYSTLKYFHQELGLESKRKVEK